MTEKDTFDPEWIEATLEDAKEALEDLIEKIRKDPQEAEEILDEEIATVYAKLNYAYNSAELGPEALVSMEDDELVSFPSVLPFKHQNPEDLKLN